jgi:hypothetical protein
MLQRAAGEECHQEVHIAIVNIISVDLVFFPSLFSTLFPVDVPSLCRGDGKVAPTSA